MNGSGKVELEEVEVNGVSDSEVSGNSEFPISARC